MLTLKRNKSIYTYISILRGINVGGHKKKLMSDLKVLYGELGFANVRTYIQSGNVIFETQEKLSSKTLSDMIEKAIYLRYKFIVSVIIRTIEEIQNIISSNPFLKETDISRLYVIFLEEIPDKDLFENINPNDYLPDKFSLNRKEIYVYCRNGFSKTKLTNNFFESMLNLKATSRNWQTVNKLFDLSY